MSKKSILNFSTYVSILLYQSFGKWKRMCNLPPAIFIEPLNAEKRFFRSKSEKMTFHTNSQGFFRTSRTRRWQQVLRLLPKKATHVAKNFIFEKYTISAFKRRVWNLYITPRYEEPAISLKKTPWDQFCHARLLLLAYLGSQIFNQHFEFFVDFWSDIVQKGQIVFENGKFQMKFL